MPDDPVTRQCPHCRLCWAVLKKYGDCRNCIYCQQEGTLQVKFDRVTPKPYAVQPEGPVSQRLLREYVRQRYAD